MNLEKVRDRKYHPAAPQQSARLTRPRVIIRLRGAELAKVGYHVSRQILALWLNDLESRSAATPPLRTA